MRGGAYLLLIRLSGPLALGRFALSPGELVYLGSARRGFGARLLRHAKRLEGPPHPLYPALKRRFPEARGTKRALFWHVDHLLEAPAAELYAALLFAGKTEAELLPKLFELGAEVAARGFGASDAKAPSHLLRLRHRRLDQLPGAVWVR